MRTVTWDDSQHQVRMIDQRLLPGEYREVSFSSYVQVAEAIQQMVVRGAPAIGASAAYGMALAAYTSTASDILAFKDEMFKAREVLLRARPTAANLTWAIDRMLQVFENSEPGNIDDLRQTMLEQAQLIADQDVQINKEMASHGAKLMGDNETVIHHCNTGALATVDWGTALGVIRMAHEQGKNPHVLVDETRPRLQGARLTAWELEQYGISYEIITDNAAGFFLSSGIIDRVLVGADRVAANGDVANKIGTYMLALAARDNQVPFFVVSPTSTVDLSLQDGNQIPIEERDPGEVLRIQFLGARVAPEGARARNPAFDVTPHRLITGIVTENGVVYPPFEVHLRQAVIAGEH
ncbi:MAG: S-methyl-5-thioribose-1-phosphate isomerase [Anaerolineales bacterium]|jgi:methylthioribose-1-phosphate isomerase